MKKINGGWILYKAQPDVGMKNGGLIEDPKQRLEYLNKIDPKKELCHDDLFFYYKFRGLANEELNREEEAIRNYSDALKNIVVSKKVTKNDIKQIYIWRGNLFEKISDSESAMSDYVSANKLDEKKRTALFEIACLLIKQKKYSEARKVIDDILNKYSQEEYFEEYIKRECKKLQDTIKNES